MRTSGQARHHHPVREEVAFGVVRFTSIHVPVHPGGTANTPDRGRDDTIGALIEIRARAGKPRLTFRGRSESREIVAGLGTAAVLLKLSGHVAGWVRLRRQ